MRVKGVFISVGLGVAIALVMALPVRAHHAFGAEFDATQPIKLKGVVTRVDWTNPHSWIHMDVKKLDGTTESWMIEGGPPNSLFRRGFSKASLPVGAEILVEGFQAKDRTLKANGRDLTFADGRKLFLGTENTGAPRDGRDPAER